MPADLILSSSLVDTPASNKEAKTLEFIEEITKNADAVQKNVLAEILAQNAETEYLKSFNLDGATDQETFKSKIPMITYEDIQPLIRRIANGDRSPILSAHPVTEFIASSGTSSGEGKLFPNNKEESDRRLLFFYNLPVPILNQYMKGVDKGKGLYFMLIKPETRTPGGLPARAAITSVYKSNHLQARHDDPYKDYTSPKEAIFCPDSFQSMYAQMLCGLSQRGKVLRVGAIFASGLLRAIKFLQLNWQQLTHDIRTGSLNPKVTDASIRESLTRALRPDPGLADSIASECAKYSWEGIISRVWPNARYLDTIITGAMTQYIPTLDYYSGELPIASTMYGSSECFIGINLNPMCNLLTVISGNKFVRDPNW